MRKLQILFLMFIATSTMAFGQKIVLDGYVFEEYNRGFLNEVKITVLDVTGIFIGETMSGLDGHFVFDGVEPGREYIAQYEKKIFKIARDTFSTVGKKAGDKIFLKKQIERQPGYLLEVTLAEKRVSADIPTDGINGCRIEVFNITKNKEELVIDSAKSQVFSVTLQQGNQYTVMIRKQGYFTKRMDANVNINGCYLCMDGFGTVNPGVTSNLTSAEDNKLGTLISNIELERMDVNRNIVIPNIYYPLGSAELTYEARKELDKVISLMKNNPALIIELGSHTDSRGPEAANLKLSQERAQAAVNYITASGWIESSRLKAKGYGESRLTNKCEDGTPCSEEEHIRNRRTELRILGFGKDPNDGLSLAEIVHQEEMMKFVLSGESEKQYSVPVGTQAPQTLPNDAVKKDLEKTPPASQAPPSVKQNSTNAMTMKQLEAGTQQAAKTTTQPTATPVDKKPIPASKLPSKVKQATTPPAQETTITPKSVEVTPPTTTETKAEPLAESTKPVEQPKPTADMSKENVKVNLSTIEKAYTGYKVELFTSKEELSTTSSDLKMVASDLSSEIQFDKLKNGQFSYMVGTFLTWGETERFLEKAQAKYPKAQIVDYYNGKRVGE